MSGEDNPSATSGPQAMCAEHPARVAAGTCTRCGNFYCSACAGRREGAEGFCRRCDQGRSYIAWEDDTLGFWSRYFETLKSSVATLPKFAAELPARGGLGRPLLFATLPTVVSALITSGVIAAIIGYMSVSWMENGPPSDLKPGMFGGIAFLFYFVGGLATYLAYLAIWPAVLLVSTRMLGGGERLQYEGLFRILCYASGLNWLYFFPVLGVLVGVYHVVVTVSCIAARGRMSTLNALAAYGLPALLFSGCCCGSYLLLMFVGLRAGAAGP